MGSSGRKPKDFFSGRLGRYVLKNKDAIEVLQTPYHTEARINIPSLGMDKYQRDAKMSGAFTFIRSIPTYKKLPVNPIEVKEEYVIFFKRGRDRFLTLGYTLADVEKLCLLFRQDDRDLVSAKLLLKEKAKFPEGSLSESASLQKKPEKEGRIFTLYEVESTGVVIV